MVQLGIRVSEFYEHESCGKCTPCREGTRWMTQILRRLEAGDGEQHELDLLLDVCDRINGKCLCPLGETAAIAVASYVDKFRGEFQEHVDEGGCPFGGSSLPRMPCVAPSGRCTRTRRPRRCPPDGRRRDGQAHDRRDRRRGAEGHGARRGGAGRRDRDPGVLLRAAARPARRRLPHVPLRGRSRPAEAAGRLHADRAGRDGRQDRADVGGRPRRSTRRSSSSSSTTRSTARCATRAASARCRT